jgi:peroxiredoxin
VGGVKVIGEFSAEFARELHIDVAEMGEMMGMQSGGLVTLC